MSNLGSDSDAQQLGVQRCGMATIEVCLALEPLGDTLAVVVNLQDVTARNADVATTLSSNCQLPEGSGS